MDKHNPGDGFFEIILLFAILIPAIFFLLSQFNTLKVVRLENRVMRPGLVWLQLIPAFGQIWQFFVVTRIADSIRKEILSGQDDSILGISNPIAAEELGKRPTFAIGITYCSLNITGIILNFFNLNQSQIIFAGLISLSGIICWVSYWVYLVRYKHKLSRVPHNR